MQAYSSYAKQQKSSGLRMNYAARTGGIFSGFEARLPIARDGLLPAVFARSPLRAGAQRTDGPAAADRIERLAFRHSPIGSSLAVALSKRSAQTLPGQCWVSCSSTAFQTGS